MHDASNRLFRGNPLDKMLERTRLAVEDAVDKLPQDEFLASTDDELVNHFVARFAVEPLKLYEDQRLMLHEEKQVDAMRDPRRPKEGNPSGFYKPGTELTITIPYTGLHELWQLDAGSTRGRLPIANALPPRGDEPGHVIILIAHPHDIDTAMFRQDYDEELDLIRRCVAGSTSQVEAFNADIPKIARAAISNRRSRLAKHANLSQLLNIPLREKPGAPPLIPIRLPPRVIPALPKSQSGSYEPEPGIAPDLFEKILAIVRHVGRTFETTPGTYAIHDEEELRDIILAHLNGHFLKSASGEAFRKVGKTDILIEDEKRAAFVAECKVWGGKKRLEAALDQLTGYLTWRDCKCAMIIFNKSYRNFTELLENVPTVLRSHDSFIAETKIDEPGEWRSIIKCAEDHARRITVHSFLFNLYWPPAKLKTDRHS